jgi:DNA-binding MarR family transcriptional regulator
MYEKIFQDAPFIALIHNISKNQIKYLKSRIEEYDLGREIRYVMMVYDNPGCSQDDLVNIYGESKANVAKALKKLEDEGFIKREVNPDNRRKYMLGATSKAEELVPKVRQISKDWEREVGIDELDFEFKEKLRQIAINGMRLQ